MRVLITCLCCILCYAVATNIDEEVAEMLKDGKIEAASRMLEALPFDERQAEGRLITLARCYALGGTVQDLEKSERILREHIGVHGDEAVGYVSLGKLLIHMNRMPEAIAVLREGEKKASSDVEKDGALLVILGKAIANSPEEKQKSKREEALGYALRAEKVGLSDAMMEYELGMLLFFLAPPANHAPREEALDIHTKGRAAMDRSRELNPSLDRRFVGKVFSHYQRFAWAAEELRAYLRETENADTDVETLVLLAECEERLGNSEAAEQWYKMTLKVAPSSPSVLISLGRLLLGLGISNYAALEACGLRRDEALGYVRKGMALLEQRREQTDTAAQALYESAQSTVTFCEREEHEVAQWKRVADKIRRHGGSGALAAGDGRGGLMQRLLEWVRRAKRALQLILGVPGAHASVSAPTSRSKEAKSEAEGTSEGAGNLTAKAEAMRKRWRERESRVPHVERTQVHSSRELMEVIKTGKPVVISNFQDHWGSVNGSAAQRRGLKAALLSDFGNDTVRVSVSASDRFDGPEDGSLWGLGKGQEVLVRPPTVSMRLGDFFTLSQHQHQHRGQRQGHGRETFYIEYLSLQQYLGNPFIDSLVPPPPQLAPLTSTGTRTSSPGDAEPSEEPQLSFLVSNMWISSGTTTISPLHYDDYENLLFMVEGEKEFLLFAPQEYPNLYYQGRPKGALRYTFPATFDRDPSTLDKRSFVFASSVNVDDPDLRRHPRYAQTRPVRAHLRAGDVLFVPSFWHHEVQSLPSPRSAEKDERDGLGAGGEGGLNMAMNIWFANITFPAVPGML